MSPHAHSSRFRLKETRRRETCHLDADAAAKVISKRVGMEQSENPLEWDIQGGLNILVLSNGTTTEQADANPGRGEIAIPWKKTKCVALPTPPGEARSLGWCRGGR
jgi:hypothetical protein